MTCNTKWKIPPPAKPVTEEYLASVTIGEREPLNNRIQLVPYDPNCEILERARERASQQGDEADRS